MKTKDGRFYVAIPHSLKKTFPRMSGEDCKQYLQAIMEYSINGVECEDDMSPAAAMAYDVTVDLNDDLIANMERNREARQKAAKARWDKEKRHDGDEEQDDDGDPDPAPPQRPAAAAPKQQQAPASEPMTAAAPVFVKPTIQTIKDFCDENDLTYIDPARFYSDCEMRDWTYNGKPIKWRNYAVFLHRREQAKAAAAKQAAAKTVTAQQYTQREYSKAELDSLDYDLTAEAKQSSQEQEREWGDNDWVYIPFEELDDDDKREYPDSEFLGVRPDSNYVTQRGGGLDVIGAEYKDGYWYKDCTGVVDDGWEPIWVQYKDLDEDDKKYLRETYVGKGRGYLKSAMHKQRRAAKQWWDRPSF